MREVECKLLERQEVINSQYSHIKQLIISKKINKVREEIRLAMAGNGREANSLSDTNSISGNSKIDLLLTVLCIENFILIVFLFFRLPKK